MCSVLHTHARGMHPLKISSRFNKEPVFTRVPQPQLKFASSLWQSTDLSLGIAWKCMEIGSLPVLPAGAG